MNQNYNFVQGLFSQVMNGKNEALATKKSTSFKGVLVLFVFALFASISMQGQNTYYSKASATSFSSLSSWGTSTDGTGAAPASISNANNFIISNGSLMTLDANSTVRTLAISNGGSLTVSANILNVSLATGNTSNLTINSGGYLTVNTGGTININGNFLQVAGGIFTQNGGNINVDGNSGVAGVTMTAGSSVGATVTVASTAGLLVNSVVAVTAGTGTFAANTVVTSIINSTQFTVNVPPTAFLSGATIYATNSVVAATNLVAFSGSPSTLFLNGGTFTIVDPHANSNSVYALSGNANPAVNASINHTFKFGNGVSTDAGFGAAGFYVYLFPGTSYLVLGNVIVDNNVTLTNNRQVTTTGTIGLLGNLTINSGGEYRASSTTQYFAGNVTNNGILTTTGTIIFGSYYAAIAQPAITTQTISGTGIFRNSNLSSTSTANFANLTFNNTSAGGIVFNGANTLLTSGNTGTVSGTLTFSACSAGVDLSGGTFVQGVNVTGTISAGTTSWTAGGFKNGTFKKWFGTTSLPTALPSTSAGNFPFVVNGANRNFQVGSSIATISSGGTISVSYTATAGLSSVVGSDPSGPFTFDRLSNANWTVNTGDGLTTSGTFIVNGSMEGITNLTDITVEPRLVQSATAGAGTHAIPTGTVTAPVGNRSGLTLSSTATNFYIGINSTNIAAANNTIYSVQNGNWNNPSTWNTGFVPVSTDAVTITVGTTVNVDNSFNTNICNSLTIAINGTLNVSANTLNTNQTTTGTGITMGSYGILNQSGGAIVVGATGINRFFTLSTGAASTSQLNVSGGTLAVNGNINVQSPAIFTQSGGTITVDGNAGGVVANSVPSGTAIFSIASPNTNLTGGSIVIVDPHANTVSATKATNRAYAYNVTTTANNVSSGHTLQIGDGTSTDAGGSILGFVIDIAQTSGKQGLGNLVINGGIAGVNRLSSLAGATSVLGSVTINANSELNQNAYQLNVNGNLTNNGSLTATSAGVLSFQNTFNNSASPSTNAQILSGTGVFRNGAISVTTTVANSTSTITVANTFVAGMVIAVQNGAGAFPVGTTVVSATTTNFVASAAPSTALPIGAVIVASNANFNSVTINNNNPAGVTFSGTNWNSFTNATLSGTLTFTNGFLDTTSSANGLTLGISGIAAGTLAYTAGGFKSGSVFRRWVATTAIVLPAVGGQFPFLNSNFQARHAFFGSATALTTAGWVAVQLNEVAGTTAATISDLYNVTARSNSNWVVTTGGGLAVANDAQLRFRGDGIFTLASPSNLLAVGASAVANGTSVAGTGTAIAPEANKTLLSTANVAQTFYVGTQNSIQSTATGGAWGSASTWLGGVVPTCSDVVLISNGATVTVTTETANNAGLTVNFGGTLTVSGGTLTVGCTNNNAPFNNNGTLTISGGIVNINGNLANNNGSNFTHSGGTITIDGNNGGTLANLNSVASGTPLFAIGSSAAAYSAAGVTTLTGGTIIIKDPHVGSATATSAYAVYGNLAAGVNVNASTAHTFQFGDGTSIDGGASTSGFVFNGFVGAGRLNFGSVIVNSSYGVNRIVTQDTGINAINGNLTITSGILNIGALTLQVGGNISVATDGHFITGTGTTLGTVNFGLTTGTTLVAQTTAQSVSVAGNGTIRSNLTTAVPTASTGSGYVVGDILTLVGTGGTLAGANQAQFRVVSVSAGVVTGVVSINAPYYTTAPTAPSAVTGGTGTGCTLTLTNTAINTNFVNVVMNNTSATGVTFNALNNQSGVATFTGASVLNNITFNGNTSTTGTNALLYGTAILRGTGSVTVNSGGMTPGSTYAIGTSAAQTGTVPATTVAPLASAAGAYPFVDASGNARYFFVGRTGPSGTGIVGIKYTDIPGVTSGLSLADGLYTVTDRYNSYWEVNLFGTSPAATSFSIAATAVNAFGGTPTSANARLMNSNAFVGSAQIGTNLPNAQRITLTLPQLTANPFYMGLAGTELPFVSITNGNWESASTWNRNAVPTATDNVTISNGTTVTVNSTASVANAVTINTTGTLTVSGNTLTTTATVTNNGTVNVSGGTLTSTTALTNNPAASITVSGSGTLAALTTVTNGGTINSNGGNFNVTGASAAGITNNAGASFIVAGGTVRQGPVGGGNTLFINSGILTVNSGTLNINGSLTHQGTAFNQSGGNINLDPNAAGITANSTSSSNYTLNLTSTSSGSLNWTGGTLTLVDPPVTASTSHYSIYYAMNAHSEIASGHTLQFGDGISSDAGGAGGGFYIYNWVGSYKGNWNNITVNGPGSAVTAASLNRIVKQTTYSNNIYGNLTINNNGEFDMSIIGFGVGNNLNVNTGGIFTATGTLTFAIPNGTSLFVNPNNAQLINGGGTIRNLSASPTANLTGLQFANSNFGGITLNTPLSVSGTLTMTSGIINTTATNILNLATTATISGTPSATNMVVGPFARTFSASRTATGTYDASTLYPVGKGTSYNPVYVDPTTSASGPAIISGEAFLTNNGTPSSDVSNLSAARWEVLTTSGYANLTSNTNVRVFNPNIASTNALVQAPTAAGVYDRLIGTSSYGIPGPALTGAGINSGVLTAAAYFAFGNVAPPAPPTISNYTTAFSSVAPITLCTNGGSVVTFTGTNLGSVTSVLFTGSTGINLPGVITAKTGSTLTVTAPAGLVSGFIQVINPTGSTTTQYYYNIAGSPTVSVTPNLTACAGAGSPITATGASTYSWTPNTALSATTGATVTASPIVNTTYTVTGMDTNGCTATNTVSITTTPSPSPIVITTTPSSVCTGTVATLNATGGTNNQDASGYGFSSSIGTFTPLTGGTVSAINFDDTISGAVPIGFNFTYAGNTYTNVYASSNGFLSFNASATNTASNTMSVPAAGIIPLIAPLWDDLDGATAGAASYLTTGTAGSRVFTFEWLNWEWHYLANAATISFQVKLYEADGKIEFVYRPDAAALTSPSASAGLVGTTVGNYLSLSNLSSTATASTTVPSDAISLKPVNGQVFTFTKPLPQPVISWSSASNLYSDSAATTAYANQNIRTVYSVVNGSQSYTATATSSNSCTSSTTFTVSPLPLPTAPSAIGSSQCGTLVPTASVAATSGAAGTRTFKWYAAATGGTALQSGTSTTYTSTISVTTTLYVSEVGTNGCESLRTPVTITITAPPALTTSALPAPICAGASTVTPVTITSTLANYNNYSITPSTGVTGTSTTGYTFNPSVTTTYVLASTNTVTGCANAANILVTVNPLPNITSATTSNEPLCLGSSTTLTALSIASAPGNATIGSATTLTSSFSYPTAFENYWYQNWQQYLFTAAELRAMGLGAGNINSMTFNIAATPSPNTPLADYNVRIGTTSNTALTTFTTTGLSNVFGPASRTATVGLNTITFTTPYNWDGISNIIIDLRQTGAFGNGNATTYYTSTSNNSVLYAYSLSNTTGFWTSAPTPTPSTSRPNIIFAGQVATDVSTNFNWSWSPAATLSAATGNVVTATPTANTIYTVTATNPTTSCSSTRTVSVSLLPVPASPTATTSIHCGNQLSTARVTSTATNGLTPPVFIWYAAATGGTALQTGGSNTFLTPVNSTRTMYVAELGQNGCESLRTPVVMTVTQPPVVTVTSSVPTFCGVGGNTTLTASSPDSGMTYTWTSFTPTATISALNTPVVTATISETSEFKVVAIASNPSCQPIESFISVGVYPLPTATVTTTAQGLCPGSSATIGSGLSAGNFTATCIPSPSTPSVAPSGAVALVAGGALQTPYPTGVSQNSTSLDDNFWSGIPVGFNFNFFGNTVTNVFIGSNGTINLGSAGSTAYTFTGGFPSTSSPASTVAVVARDLHWGRVGAGKITYWTEGIAPNRRFIVQFLNAPTFGTTGTPALPNGMQTAEAVFYETLGTIDIRVFEATYANAKYIGLQDATQLIGATAPNCNVTPNTSNYWNGVTAEIPSTAPRAWRFTPPSNYTTVWSANGVVMPSVTANPTATPPVVGYSNPGTNVFSIPVAPLVTTTYSITYTNLTSGCANAPGSAQVVMGVLGNVAPVGVNTIADNSTICLGQSVNLSTSYTGLTDGIVFQWQNSIDGGTTWNDIASATSLTLTDIPVTPCKYRLKMVACNGVPGYTSVATIGFYNNVLTSSPAVRCGVGTASLSATGSTGTTLNWYANASGGTAIGTGTTFVTPTINASTTYYVGAETITPQTVTIGSVLAPSNVLTTASPNGGMIFNTTVANVRINSASIFVSGTGDMVFNLQDSNGVDIASTTITGVVGSSTALTTVNFPSTFVVPNIGTGYRIICTSLGAGLTWYYQTGAYPFNTPGVSITSGWGWTATTTDLRCIHKLNFTLPLVCSSSRVAVPVTVTPPPAITLSGNPATICAESNSTPVTVTTGASNYSSYVWTPNTVTGNATTGWVFNPLTTTTYTLLASQTTGTTPCANNASVTVSVNPTPTVITIAPAPASTCANTILPLVATGGLISPNYVSSMDVLPTDFTVDSPTNSSATVNTTYYSEGTGSVLFNVPGTSSNASYSMNTNINMSNSTNATLKFSHIAAMEGSFSSFDYGYVEYSLDGGTTWINFTPADYVGTADATVFNANARFSTRSYADWVSQFTSSTATPGTGPATSLWKEETFNIPASALTSSQFRIRFRYTTDISTNYYGWLIDNVRIIKSVPSTMVWSPTTNLYSDAAATVPYVGENLNTVYFKTNAAAPAVTYTATATSTLGCSRVASVPVTVYQTAAPTGSQFFQFCPTGGATVSTMSPAIFGTNIKWYSTSTGGTALAPTTPLAQGYYWASQTANGCESPTRFLVFAISNATVAPSSSPTQQFCNSATVSNLTANGTGIKWYTTAIGGTALASSATLASGTYYVSQTSGGCESPRSAVSVTVNSVPAPTGAATQSLSSLLTLGDIAVTGSNIVWYASAANAASGTNPLPSTQLLANTTYYATQTINGCSSSTSLAVTITTLANQEFDMTQFTYYPNPVIDLLNITYSQDMTSVKVFNMVGQQLMSKQVNSNTVQVDMSRYANGAYFIQVTTENAMKTVRVIKK
jgi:hypothetical protein